MLRPKLFHLENQWVGCYTCPNERPLVWLYFLYGRIYVDFPFLTVHKVCTKARLLGERSVRIREVKGSNPSRSTNLPHRFVRCGVFYVQKTLADRAGLRTLKSDANRVGSSMYFLKIHRFHASFFAFCRVLRASASLLCPLLGNSFKNFRTIVG